MKQKKKAIVPVTRRTVLAGQVGAIAATALPSLTNSALAKVPQTETQDGMSVWSNLEATDLKPFVGQRFVVKGRNCGSVAVKLTHVEEYPSGPHRPENLSRSDGFVAVFESPDMETLVGEGDGIYRLSHARFGAMDVFAGPVPKRGGGHTFELGMN